MENQLLKKLLIKPGFKLFVANAPDDLDLILGDVPDDVKVSTKNSKDANAILLFATDSRELGQHLPGITAILQPETICWIAYPKKTSKIPSDLYLMGPWTELMNQGVNIASSVSLGTTWSGVRVRLTGQSKASGMCLEDIARNEYGEFIDVANRTVTMPPDLQKAVAKNKPALAFFNTLSFSNQKEYVLWVLSAKQEKTRTDRIGKTVAKLAEGMKNPSAK